MKVSPLIYYCRVFTSLLFLVLFCSCSRTDQARNNVPLFVDIVKEPALQKSENLPIEVLKRDVESQDSLDYFDLGYNDGYEDGDHLEKGHLFKHNIPEEMLGEYRKGYFAGYADGRAAADPTDDYYTGYNNTDYFDLSDDVYKGDEDEWSDEEDW